jgi:hypothetical protein
MIANAGVAVLASILEGGLSVTLSQYYYHLPLAGPQ